MNRFDSPWDAIKASLHEVPGFYPLPPAPKATPSYYILDMTAAQLLKDFSGYTRSFSSRSAAETEANKLASSASGSKRYLVVKSVVEIESKKTTQTISKEFA